MAKIYLGKDVQGNDMWYGGERRLVHKDTYFHLVDADTNEKASAEELLMEIDRRLKEKKKNIGMFAWIFNLVGNFGKDFSGEPQS